MSARYPIVFLPGVMGSRLYFLTSQKYWDPDHTGRMLQWAPVWPFRSADDLRRQMHARERAGVLIDSDAGVTAAERDRGWGGVVWSFYGAFLRDLQDVARPAPVYAIGYDWRQDLWWLADTVRAKILRVLQLAGAERVIVATHSMGGLVLRSAFARDPALKEKVEGILYICQPSVGAVVLYRRLFTGLVRDFDGGGSLADRAFRLILGNTREDFLANMSGLPGPMQLLPSEHYPADPSGLRWNAFLDEDRPWNDFYQNRLSPPGLIPEAPGLAPDAVADLRRRVAELRVFHQRLGPPRDERTAHPKAWLLYGSGVLTETRFAFRNGEVDAGRTDAGDSVVPALSATALGLDPDRQSAIPGLTHADACLHRDVRRKAKTILRTIYGDDDFADVPVLGRLAPEAAAAKLQELATGAVVGAQAAPEVASFGILDWLGARQDQLWRHTTHAFGYIAPAPAGSGLLSIRHAGDMEADATLRGARIKITLDRLRVASYPGGGIHQILFDFAAQNQAADGVEHLHFNATSKVREGGHAAVLGLPIFIGLNVGGEGVAFRCFTVNVKNEEDEALLDFLDSDAFRAGLRLGTTVQPAVGPLSAAAVGLTKALAARHRNVPVQDFTLGLDFSAVPTRARLAEGSYLAVQVPEDQHPTWDWGGWAYNPASGSLIRRDDPAQSMPYNYLVISISRLAPDRPAPIG